MRSIRVSGWVSFILVLSCSSGCGYDEGDHWATGTAAWLKDRDAPRVLGRVPTEQRAIAKRRSLAFPNNTRVTVVDDPAYRALSKDPTRSDSLRDHVRVKVTTGVDQEVELIVRRQDLAPTPGPNDTSLAFLLIVFLAPILFLVLIALAATVSSIETVALRWKRRREFNRDEITIYARARVESLTQTPRRPTRVTDRGDTECDQWLAWVAAMTARRKLRCMDSRSRATTLSR